MPVPGASTPTARAVAGAVRDTRVPSYQTAPVSRQQMVGEMKRTAIITGVLLVLLIVLALTLD